MSPKTTTEIAKLADMTVAQLRDRYEAVFNEECRSRNKQYLIRRIAWRLQANEEGGLSAEAKKKAVALAVDAESRVTAPREHKNTKVVEAKPAAFVDWDPRLPPPNTVLERQYKGEMIRVVVLQEGFEYEGERYRSLTAVAKKVTGTHTNGFLFFRLGRRA
ncbi:DUF2924 domain-containing protein [Crateriforma conspicua]|uniref:DUF2924 domain-containing protein n=1 Tax=Crateriforma conspicua TaxID=2527996 RepID=A0A5C5Y8B0_9PLAN|nr:DUF2924 domain-containing protein [Crateriforma conspicua]TWT71560.1 hypothetical protein Pan14r_38700 [Crateriforma conspicua]